MKTTTAFLTLLILSLTAAGQTDSLAKAKGLKAKADVLFDQKFQQKLYRTEQLYRFRAYSLSIGLTGYTGVSSGASPTVMGLFDIEFDDRLLALDLLKNGAMEEHFGIGFLPYQGTQIHLGADIELLKQSHRVNLFAGAQYTVGLPQSSSPNYTSSVYLGWHQYAEPCIGVDYWPGKLDIENLHGKQMAEYNNQKFDQLFYLRLQIGYSFLLNRLTVDSTGNLDPKLYQIVRRNTGSNLAVKITVGIDIPSLGGKFGRYSKYEHQQGYMPN